MATNPERYMEQPLPFGQWLLTQKDKPGLIGQLAAGAAANLHSPRAGIDKRRLGTLDPWTPYN